MIGQSSETGTTFFTRARRNASDGLFYFKDITSLYYNIPIADGFSMLKFTQPGFVYKPTLSIQDLAFQS
jgi:hypothetical protein